MFLCNWVWPLGVSPSSNSINIMSGDPLGADMTTSVKVVFWQTSPKVITILEKMHKEYRAVFSKY